MKQQIPSYTCVVPSKPYPIPDQNGKMHTRLQTETAQKPYPLGRHIPIWLIQGSIPRGYGMFIAVIVVVYLC